MIGFNGMTPAEPKVTCRDCGAVIYAGDVASWVTRYTRLGTPHEEPVCENCVDDYQPCGHHKDSIQYASADALDDTTHWCAECEGE